MTNGDDSDRSYQFESAQKEFNESVGACYIFLLGNGLSPEGAKILLEDSLHKIIDQVDKEKSN